MNHLMQVTVIEPRESALYRTSVFLATDGQIFYLYDWPEIPESCWASYVERRCALTAIMPGDSPLYCTWRGSNARQQAIEWIETQLPF